MNKKIKREEKINEEITSKFVRIVGKDLDSKIVELKEAFKLAEDTGLDLVEISPNANPPVVKVIDYQKYLYEKKKKEKEQKQNNKKVKVKELRFTYNTGISDFNFKLNHAINFLKEGNKVKAYVFFSGREMNYIDTGNILLLKFLDALTEFGKPEALPKLDGKRLWVVVQPKK